MSSNIIIDEFINHYKVLGISQDASNKEIRMAYKNLCLIYHPDKLTGDPLVFEQINDSYYALKDPASRQQYDLSLKTHDEQSGFDNLKNNFNEYIKTPDNFIPKVNEELFIPVNAKDKITKDDSFLEDLVLIREQDDLENLPEIIFNEKEEFNNDKFNETFVDSLDTLPDNDGSNIDYNTLFKSSCRETNVDEAFNSSTLDASREFIDQFTISKGLKACRNTSDRIDNDYFKKLLEERNKFVDSIEYSNGIVDGVDYKSIGF